MENQNERHKLPNQSDNLDNTECVAALSGHSTVQVNLTQL